MKKITKYLLFAALGMTLAACTNDEISENFTTLTPDGYELPFKAVMADEGMPVSRVRYASNEAAGGGTNVKKIDWVDGDLIKYFRKKDSNTDEYKFHTKNVLDDGKITSTNLYCDNSITWTSGTYKYQAIYPYSRVNSMDETNYNVTIPSLQDVGVGVSTDSLLRDEYGKYWQWDGSQYVAATKETADKRKQYSACDYSCLLLRAAGTTTVTGTTPGKTTFNFYAICRGFDVIITAPRKGKGLIKKITLEFYSDQDLTTPFNVVGTFTGNSSDGNNDATESQVILDFTKANSNDATKVLLEGTDRVVARAFLSRGVGTNLRNKFIKISVDCTLWDTNDNSEDKTFYRTVTTKSLPDAGAYIDMAYMGDLPSIEHGVDLGLTGADILWGTENVNANIVATGNHPQGTFYAWASIDDVTTFNFNTYKTLPLKALAAYKFATGSGSTTQYREPYGQGYTNHSIRDSNYDVAKVKVGGKWHMPNTTELKALVDECTWSWDGEKYIATGPNSNKLTIYPGKDGTYGGTDAYFWSCQKENSGAIAKDDEAYALHVSGGVIGTPGGTINATVELIPRYSGCLVCPVRDK